MTIPRWLAAAIGAFLLAGTATATLGQTPTTAAPPTPTATCGAASGNAPTDASPLPNPSQAKDAITAYYGSGDYDADVAAVEALAQTYLEQRVAGKAQKPALVLDIDDTALSTYGYESAHDFRYDPASWNQAATAGFPAIPATVALAKRAEQLGIAIFFVTDRPESQLAITHANLRAAKYDPPAGIYFRPADDRARSVVPFKSLARADIEARGYDVLAAIGDQWSDLACGHAERIFKLPNPMYVLP